MSSADVVNPSCMDSAKMSTATARAEARRRRILENSAARLARITGKPEEEQPEEKNTCCQGIPSNLPTIEPSIDSTDDAYTFNQDRFNFIEEPPSQIFQLIENSSEANRSSEPPKQKTSLDIFIETRLHIPLICITIQALYMSNNVIDGFLFLPLIAWEIAEIILFDSCDPRPRLSTILSILRLPEFKHNMLLKFLKILYQFSEDALFYIFTFIIMQFIMIVIDKNR